VTDVVPPTFSLFFFPFFLRKGLSDETTSAQQTMLRRFIPFFFASPWFPWGLLWLRTHPFFLFPNDEKELTAAACTAILTSFSPPLPSW